jgi:hypothetical protein
MKKPYYLVTGLCAAGLLTGFTAKRLTRKSAPTPQETQSEHVNERRPLHKESADLHAIPESGKPTAAIKSGPRSSDTLDDIIALDDKDNYARLALWMLDASEQDIAAYWQHYRQQKNRSNEINDLIFINWTRLNPQGAIAAATNTPDEHYAWWAWACHDPRAALAAVLSDNPKRLNNVTWSIGEFHGEWLRKHFDEIPENGRDMAIQGLVKWDDKANPEEILKFLKEHNAGFDNRIFGSLIRKDPWGAFDWIQENGTTQRSRYGGRQDVMDAFVKTMSESHPDVLERIAQQTPSGEMKRKMEAALFENLLKTDPEAAIEQAKSTKAPLIAAQRLAAAGMSLIGSDPERSFELASRMFALGSGALSSGYEVKYPNGGSSRGSSNEEATQFTNALLAKDPARMMAMVKPTDNPHGSTSFTQLAGNWAQQDLPGYANWVNSQSDPIIRESAAQTLINQLQNDGQFTDAADWAMSLNHRTREGYLSTVVHNWQRSNPDEAREWLEAADLPEQEKQNLQQYLNRQ